MSIIFHESSKTFHLYNNEISYIMTVLPNGHLGNLYFGKRIHENNSGDSGSGTDDSDNDNSGMNNNNEPKSDNGVIELPIIPID